MKRIAVVVLLAASAAHADELTDTGRLEGGLGIRMGSMLVDNRSVGSVHPGHLDVGWRADRLFLYGEYELASLTYPITPQMARGDVDPGSGTGLAHRFTANARWSYGRLGENDGGADLWAELGAGFERIAWDAGGNWTRPQLALGLGLAMWGAGEHRHGGLSFALRVTLSRRNDVDRAPEVCGGPCDYATTPTGWDRAFLFDISLMFGR